MKSWVPSGSRGQYLATALLSNTPQVALSIGYLMYNSIITEFTMAREWARMSTHYRGLRVTDPRGEQKSTYWLQLPLSYSIPMILVSILLHWVLSTGIYPFVTAGSK
jgi:hypothetical protein